MSLSAGPFDLLFELYGDREMAAVLSAERTIKGWMAAEAALAAAQADLGIIDKQRAQAIADVCASPEGVDSAALWESARTVGYPILGLVRQLDAALAQDMRGSLHLGATTQDIMDTGLALQLDAAMNILEQRLRIWGDALAERVADAADVVMPGRTHGQQAVPTTVGAKFAVYLDEVNRHRIRLITARDDVRRVSLHGAGGTSAGYGQQAGAIRSRVAKILDLNDSEVPWHVARDSLVHLAAVAVGAATTASRLGREITDLARTEIGEIGETVGHHRGASSTMPQKANPITSESIIGFAVSARSALGGLSRAAEAGHERSAGEWQVEWVLLPSLLVNVSSALMLASELTTSLMIYPERMRRNLQADQGLIMAESAMISLSESYGREAAHDLVYNMALTAREGNRPFAEVLNQWAESQPEAGDPTTITDLTTVGHTQAVCRSSIDSWRASLANAPSPWKGNDD